MPRLEVHVPAGYTIVAGKSELRKALRKAGAEVAVLARRMIRHGGTTRRRKATRVSMPGTPPVNRTGNLSASIVSRTWKDGEGVSIRDRAFYALFLETGARGGGGNTKNPANILPAGERKWVRGRWKILRSQNRMKKSAINRTRILLPHPFIQPALDKSVANGLAQRLRDALISGIALRRGNRIRL